MTRKKASTLTASDTGRATVDGLIERVDHSSDGTRIIFTSGDVLALSEGDAVEFIKPQPRN